MTSRVVSPTRDNKKPLIETLKDPQVVRINNQLDIIYTLFNQFIGQVRSQAA
jgi:hypothetical protein